jgi:hypothetical protein
MPTGRKVRGDPERVLLSFPLRSVIGSNRKQEIPFAGHTREKMKPKPRKRILGVLATVLLLIFFQLPFAPIASGALLPGGWPDTPSIFDPLGDDSPGRDIYEGAWWAYSGGSYYFRMDLLGSFNKNSYYGFYFDTDGNSGTGGSFSGSGLNLTGIDMFVSSYYNNRGLFINTNLQTWNTGLNDWNSPTSLPSGSFCVRKFPQRPVHVVWSDHEQQSKPQRHHGPRGYPHPQRGLASRLRDHCPRRPEKEGNKPERYRESVKKRGFGVYGEIYILESWRRRDMKKFLLFPVVIFVVLMAFGTSDAALLGGKQINVRWLYPDTSTQWTGWSYGGDITVVTGIEISDINTFTGGLGADAMEIDLSDTNIKWYFYGTGTHGFDSATFNGFQSLP